MADSQTNDSMASEILASDTPANRRRAKPQLSCNPCRRRKLKCNREFPCSTCLKRGSDNTCTYPPDPMQPSKFDRSASSMQAKIQHLESLIINLMEQNKNFTPNESTVNIPPMTSLEAESRDEEVLSRLDPGNMRLSKSGTSSYVNGNHWAAVLDGIAELKDFFEKEERDIHQPFSEPEQSVPASSALPQLLSGDYHHATREQLLASLPKKPEVDRLVSFFFNSFDMSPSVLHSREFLKEYETFWQRPAETPIAWLGLLYSIMCLAAHFLKYRFESDFQSIVSTEYDCQMMVERFRERTVQCLILGKYHTGEAYQLETLMLYTTYEYLSHQDAQIGTWLLLGIIVQLSLHMGYHRDPEHFEKQGISPFAGEMRRRIWATVMDMDFAISGQMGLPRLIKPWQADTKEPQNYIDSDFDRHTTELAVPRPSTEYTPMLYRISKSRLLAALGLILDGFSDVRNHPAMYPRILSLDAEWNEAYAAIPECLKWSSMANSIMDPPQVILQKLLLDEIFHKGKIIIHQKYFLQKDEKYSPSHRACVDAALAILSLQRTLDAETQPFCQLYQERWKISSIVNHDFLLAASILCSYLQQNHEETDAQSADQEKQRIYDALRVSQKIWTRSSSSKEARKAVFALEVVLRGQKPAVSVESEDNDSTTARFHSYSDIFLENEGIFDNGFPGSFPSLYADGQDPQTTPTAMPCLSYFLSPDRISMYDTNRHQFLPQANWSFPS